MKQSTKEGLFFAAVAAIVVLFFLTLALPKAKAADSFGCGWDFERSEKAGVPLTYCWATQDLAPVIRGLNPACSGNFCPVANWRGTFFGEEK